RERHLDHTEQQREHEPRDEHGLGDGRPALGRRDHPRPVTDWMASVNAFSRSGPATAQSATTRPAVISVTRTHPGTSPRSGSLVRRVGMALPLSERAGGTPVWRPNRPPHSTSVGSRRPIRAPRPESLWITFPPTGTRLAG